MREKKTTKKYHSQNKAYLYLLPAITVAALFYWYPSLKSIVESFLTVNQSGKILGFAGLDNYRRLFSDPAFINSLKVSLTFIALFVPANTFITLLAASLTRRPSRLSFIPEYIFFAPVAVSLSAYSLLMRDIFRGQASVLNNLLGTTFSGITSAAGAMAVLVVLGIFLDFGLDYILLICAFRSIDSSVVEAARMDGAGGWRLYWLVEVPMIKDTVLVTVFLALKDAILISAPIIILTEGGPFRSTETVMFYYYTEAFRSGNRGVQNALAALVLTLAALIMTIYTTYKKIKEER
ncbi:MAG: sugar ABC transporter permease [Sphaerochaetaceae bacterium]|nr:sugar ABC transporter permease [Sphaerochaetaceae bacterium]